MLYLYKTQHQRPKGSPSSLYSLAHTHVFLHHERVRVRTEIEDECERKIFFTPTFIFWQGADGADWSQLGKEGCCGSSSRLLSARKEMKGKPLRMKWHRHGHKTQLPPDLISLPHLHPPPSSSLPISMPGPDQDKGRRKSRYKKRRRFSNHKHKHKEKTCLFPTIKPQNKNKETRREERKEKKKIQHRTNKHQQETREQLCPKMVLACISLVYGVVWQIKGRSNLKASQVKE